MKNTFMIINFILIVSFNIFAEKTTIAIIDFSAKGDLEKEKYLADAIVENLITSFIESDEFVVIERSMLKEVMRELKMQNSDDFNDELRNQIGKLYSAKIVILGSLTKIGNRYTINVRGVEVETGIAKFAKNLTTDSKESLVDLIPQIVSLITGKEVIKDKLVQNKSQTTTKSTVTIKENNMASDNVILKTSKEIYSSNEQIDLNWSGLPGNQNDWITIVPEGTPNDTFQEWFYTNGVKNGSYSFKPLSAGTYEIRVYFNWPDGEYIVQAKKTIKVKK